MDTIARRSVKRRTQLATVAGLRIVPVAAFMLVFAVGELGWHLGAWYLPALGLSAVAAPAATVAASRWHRSRFGRVSLRRDWRVVTVLVVFVAALWWARAMGPTAIDSPVFVAGALLGGVIAGLSWQAPWAYAQHLVIGAALVVASLLPLGAWVEVPLPPAAVGLPEPVHPLAAYERLIAPAWLLLAGMIEHLRLQRTRRHPPAAATR